MSKKDKSYELELLDNDHLPTNASDRRAEVMVNPSGVPFLNWLNERKLKSFDGVVRASNKLLGSIKDHQMALADLQSVGLDIDAELVRKQDALAGLKEVAENNERLKEQRQRLEKEALDLQEAKQRLAQKTILVQEAELDLRLKKLEKKNKK